MTDSTAQDTLAAAASRADDLLRAAAEKASAHLLEHAEDRLEATAERAATKAIDNLFERLGVDTRDPFAMQKDFAHLRAWRESTEQIKRKGFLTMTGVLVTGGLAILYGYFTHKF
jgi:hypothetical protein